MTRLVCASLLAIGVLAVGCGDDAAKGNPDGSVVDAAGAADAAPDAAPVPTAERGKYIVDHLAACADCHTPRDKSGAPDLTRYLAGADCFIDIAPQDGQVGCLSSRNLTNHATGLMTRTDAQIKAMFQDGKRPDNTALIPVMPYYIFHNMATVDADSVVLYLRTVPGVDHTIQPNQPPFNTPPAQPAPPLSPTDIPQPTTVDAHTTRGRYLASMIGLCIECHTPRTNPQDFRSLDTTKMFAGGDGFPAAALGLPSPPFPEVIFTSNITPHATTGIGDYSKADIVKVLKQGIDKEGHGLCPPMPAGPMGAYGGLTDDDANDMAAYLLALPPVENMVAPECTPPAGP